MQEQPVQLLEEDLIRLFNPRHKKISFWAVGWNLTRSLVYFFLLYSFFFLSINSPAYLAKFGYFWNNSVHSQNIGKNDNLNLLKPANQSGSDNQDPTLPDGETISSFILNHVSDNHLVIPKINVDAPVIWNSPEANVLQDLQKGVAHYQGTSLPGENGNVFISGHSSNYWWDKGLYNHVFTLLDKMEVGDRIYINYNNKPYVYQVESIKTVKPTDITVLNPTDHSVVTLMTCTPVGTTLNRLIVQARQVYPASNKPSTKKTINTNQLPAVR